MNFISKIAVSLFALTLVISFVPAQGMNESKTNSSKKQSTRKKQPTRPISAIPLRPMTAQEKSFWDQEFINMANARKLQELEDLFITPTPRNNVAYATPVSNTVQLATPVYASGQDVAGSSSDDSDDDAR